ncbi:hypothetical protein FHE66_14630 [Georgenia sp. 311]|uniref:hypothetical protein n=1 Tax=Georgenia sp. 311 TaxID=2585134 RepID=UPI001111DCC9|nr:hypothetical protein [Georgenia sp. 311]TNC16609.1 hypothetical protein FHE66_14630 [Georgenia sp. 311]
MSVQFPGVSTVAAADTFRAFTMIVDWVSKWVSQEQETKRTIASVNAQRDVIISGIEAQRDFLLRSLDVVFDERRTAFRDLFARLDVAMSDGNDRAVADLLSAITALATKNPFSELRDHRIVIEQFRSEKVWEV